MTWLNTDKEMTMKSKLRTDYFSLDNWFKSRKISSKSSLVLAIYPLSKYDELIKTTSMID